MIRLPRHYSRIALAMALPLSVSASILYAEDAARRARRERRTGARCRCQARRRQRLQRRRRRSLLPTPPRPPMLPPRHPMPLRRPRPMQPPLPQRRMQPPLQPLALPRSRKRLRKFLKIRAFDRMWTTSGTGERLPDMTWPMPWARRSWAAPSRRSKFFRPLKRLQTISRIRLISGCSAGSRWKRARERPHWR